MRRNILFILLIPGLAALISPLRGQGSPDYTGGLTVPLNENGSKYFRLISWHQVWATAQKDDQNQLQTDFLLRRSRVLMYAQINDRFLINTHFGLNNLGPDNMGANGPVGEPGQSGQLFLHDAWVQYAVLKGKLDLGGGLHYWNGISRLTSQSTLNMLTLDAPIHNWPTIGTTDQFARHLGFFAKGKLGRLDYRLAINEAISNPSRGYDKHTAPNDTGTEILVPDRVIYRNPENPGGGKVYQGYVNYQLLEQESNLLPYFTGSYLGTRKVFNIGVGFFHHVAGATSCDEAGQLTFYNPTSLAVDVFYDSPLGTGGAAITAYGSAVRHDWGPNWTGGVGGVGTGTILFGQLGYLLPAFTDRGRLQAYIHLTHRDLEAYRAYREPIGRMMGGGVNWYIDGHHAKLTLEYQHQREPGLLTRTPSHALLRLQAMVYL